MIISKLIFINKTPDLKLKKKVNLENESKAHSRRLMKT